MGTLVQERKNIPINHLLINRSENEHNIYLEKIIIKNLFFWYCQYKEKKKMKRKSACVVYLIVVVAAAMWSLVGSSEPVPNGCGPKEISARVNLVMEAIGEGNLIPCCNQHDMCYGYCQGRQFCDDQFAQCLVAKCDQLPTQRVYKCKRDAFRMSLAVKVFGEPFYCTGEKYGTKGSNEV